MAIDLAALALKLETRGLTETQRGLLGLDQQGQKVGATFDRVAKAGQAVGQTIASASLDATRRVMAQEAQLKANAAALQRVERQAKQTFERIAVDVGRATADYRLGIIGLQDYQQALAFARQEAIQLRAVSNALSPQQLAAFDKVLTNIAKSADVARRATRGVGADAVSLGSVLGQASTTVRGGVNRIVSGVSQLAVASVGARSAVGSLATGALISFGASAGLTLAVVAGVAAIAFVFDKLTASSRKAREETTKTIDGLVDAAEKRLPAATKIVKDFNVALAEQQRLAKLRTDPNAKFDFSWEGFKQFSARVDKKPMPGEERVNAAVTEGKAAMLDEGQRLNEENLERLTKAVELGRASRRERELLRQQLPALNALARDENLLLEERNKAQERANQIQDALDASGKRSAEQRKETLDALRDEAALLVDTARDHKLSATEVERLRAIYERLTRTLATLNLTDKQRLELLRAQRGALTELATQTSVTPGGAPSLDRELTFGRQSFATLRPRVTPVRREPTDPFAGMKFGPDEDQTSEFFRGANFTDRMGIQFNGLGERIGAAFGKEMDVFVQRAGDALERADANIAERDLFTRLKKQQEEDLKFLGESINTQLMMIGQNMTLVLAQGVAAGLSSEKPLQALGDTILHGLGDIFTQMGETLIAYGVTMVKLLPALSNPFTSGPAALIAGSLLVALGKTLGGIALGKKGGGGGGTAPATPTGERVTVAAGGEITHREPIDTGSRARSTFSPSAPVPVTRDTSTLREPSRVVVQQSFLVLGSPDARAQRYISDAANEGAKRGLTFGVARRG